MEGEKKKLPMECVVVACESLPVFEYVGNVIDEAGKVERRACYLCLSHAHELVEDGGPDAQLKLDLDGRSVILRR
jgi:hypothetical protein